MVGWKGDVRPKLKSLKKRSGVIDVDEKEESELEKEKTGKM